MPAWISARLLGYAAAALAVLLVLDAWQHRAAQLTAARADLATYAATYATLAALAEEQNRTIEALRLQGELQAQTVADAQARARAAMQDAQRRVQHLLQAQVPAVCHAAVGWARTQAADIAQRWAP